MHVQILRRWCATRCFEVHYVLRLCSQSAAVSDDGRSLVLRTENPNSQPVTFSASIRAGKTGAWAPQVKLVTLAADSLNAMNDYETPHTVVPVAGSTSMTGNVLTHILPPFSFCVLSLISETAA